MGNLVDLKLSLRILQRFDRVCVDRASTDGYLNHVWE